MATRKSNLSIVLITGGILVIIVVLIYLFVFSVGARYNKAVGEADEHFVSSRYEQARTMYNEALTLKPGEEYPREQLAKIDSIAKVRRTVYQYRNILSSADSLFVAKKYEGAKIHYLEASALNQDDPYPVQQIKKIDSILAGMETEEAKAEGNFHIVVGVFENESNVEQMMEKMNEKGLNPRIVPRKEFEMQAVTYASYPDIHEAYNNLQKVQQEVDPNAWVIWHRFK